MRRLAPRRLPCRRRRRLSTPADSDLSMVDCRTVAVSGPTCAGGRVGVRGLVGVGESGRERVTDNTGCGTEGQRKRDRGRHWEAEFLEEEGAR